jgi:hypothetical protein
MTSFRSTDGWRIKILAREVAGTLDAEIATGKNRTDILIASRIRSAGDPRSSFPVTSTITSTHNILNAARVPRSGLSPCDQAEICSPRTPGSTGPRGGLQTAPAVCGGTGGTSGSRGPGLQGTGGGGRASLWLAAAAWSGAGPGKDRTLRPCYSALIGFPRTG